MCRLALLKSLHKCVKKASNYILKYYSTWNKGFVQTAVSQNTYKKNGFLQPCRNIADYVYALSVWLRAPPCNHVNGPEPEWRVWLPWHSCTGNTGEQVPALCIHPKPKWPPTLTDSTDKTLELLPARALAVFLNILVTAAKMDGHFPVPWPWRSG